MGRRPDCTALLRQTCAPCSGMSGCELHPPPWPTALSPRARVGRLTLRAQPGAGASCANTPPGSSRSTSLVTQRFRRQRGGDLRCGCRPMHRGHRSIRNVCASWITSWRILRRMIQTMTSRRWMLNIMFLSSRRRFWLSVVAIRLATDSPLILIGAAYRLNISWGVDKPEARLSTRAPSPITFGYANLIWSSRVLATKPWILKVP